MTDEFDSSDSDDEDESQDESSEDRGSASDAAEDGKSESEDEKESKRVRDLQSAADKAVAKANKLQKQLDEANAKAAKSNKDEPEVPASVQEWLNITQERAQKTLFDSDSRFKEYDVSPDLIDGATPAAMRQSAETLSKVLDSVEGKVRNKVLQEHGFAPEPASSERNEPKNFRSMSSEEFNKIAEAALQGGTLRRS
jgi:hypothetical protein